MYYSSVNAGHAIVLILIGAILSMAVLVTWAVWPRDDFDETEEHEDPIPRRADRPRSGPGRHRHRR